MGINVYFKEKKFGDSVFIGGFKVTGGKMSFIYCFQELMYNNS